MQKRTKLIFTAAVLALALAGCGSSSSSSSSQAASSTAPSSSAAASSGAASSEASSSAQEEQQTSTLDLDGAFDELLKANPISNQFEIAAMNIEYDFGLDAADVVSYKGVKSNDNGDAGLVLVIETPAGRSEAVHDTLETYKKDQVAFYGNYAEFAQAQSNVENAMIGYADGEKAGFVMMVIASNDVTDSDAISQAGENAIDIAMG